MLMRVLQHLGVPDVRHAGVHPAAHHYPLRSSLQTDLATRNTAHHTPVRQPHAAD